MAIDKTVLLSNDVETTSIWFNDLRDETGLKVWKEGMPILLDIYRKFNIKSTFFYTAYIAKLYPETVRMILADGHEVGSHGKSHTKENGFDIMPFDKQKRHLEYSKNTLEDISGQEVISFRSPAIRVSSLTARALIETGFRIDSSIASQRFDFFLSFGGMRKLNFLKTPRLPYRTKVNDIFSKGNSELIELPMSATLLPFIGSTMRIMPGITSIQQRLLHLESLMTSKPAVFVIHPNELIDETNEPRTIKRRSSNQIAYLLSDVIRAKLKSKNLGNSAVPLYEKLIQYYVDKGYVSHTMKSYADKLIAEGRV
ncbi:MAG: polysaccharide deacetylase [Candidatus Cloacimonetes bacterium HGW-Cloacimonetes-3]|nr:MAG: polysaccharide deacetylase [Candidatus Cloacimonetes bacterium HGW-Cloacimonetes-3]